MPRPAKSPAKASTKRKFFILTYQDRTDLQVLDDYDLANFDDRPLDSGRPLAGPIPKKVKLWVTSGKPADYLAGPLSWLIFSDALVQKLWPLIEESVQVLDAPLRMRKGGRQVTGYKIVNVLSRIAAVARVDGKKTVNLTQLMLIDGSKIPADVHLFRLRESPTVFVGSEEFVKLCKGRTIAFFATKTV
jgi:hypothetical protein